AAAIRSVVENFPITPGHVERLQNAEIAPVLNSAPSVARCFVQVDVDPIQAIFWIDLAVDLADEFFVSAGNREFMSPGKDLSSLNNKSRDHKIIWRIADGLWHMDRIKELYAVSHML